MTRLNLPISQLRGQTYDGAANMSGHLQGVQAILKKKQPMALYCHCGAHCVNLITQAVCVASVLVRDSMGLVHELGGFFNQSGKFKLIFQDIAKSEHNGRFTNLKPLCPTRWTVRTHAIRSVLRQYESVLTALEEMASCSSAETSAKASGLHGAFLKGSTLLCLVMAEDLTGDLECLNTSLQCRKHTISGMLGLWTMPKQACSTNEQRRPLMCCSQTHRRWQQSLTYNPYRCLMFADLQIVTPVRLQLIPILMPSHSTEPNFTLHLTQQIHNSSKDLPKQDS